MPQTTLNSTEALARAHAALLKDLRRLKKSLSLPDPDNLQEAMDRLDVLSRRLEQHFRLEEENGYMDAVLARSPYLERTIAKLKDDHEQLLKTARQISEAASTGRRIDDIFRDQIIAFIEAVRDHEKRENILIEDAFNQDIGNED